jgi:hypothetical protein
LKKVTRAKDSPSSACSSTRRPYIPRGVVPVGRSNTASGFARILAATNLAAAALMAS